MASSRCNRCSSQLVSTVTASKRGGGLVSPLGPFYRRGLGGLERFAAGAGMHRDQFGPQRRRPPAGTGHRGRDVVKFEIEEHPQPLLAQLGHHLRAGLHKQLQAHLHPAQPVHLAAKASA